jgi:hypothetical protein
MHYLEEWVKRADPRAILLILDLGLALSLSGLIVTILKRFLGIT